MEKLNLDLRSIRSIFDFKVKVIKNEKKFMKIANNLIINEILLVSQQGSDNASIGYHTSWRETDHKFFDRTISTEHEKKWLFFPQNFQTCC